MASDGGGHTWKQGVIWGLTTPFVVFGLGAIGLGPPAAIVVVIAAVYGAWDMTVGRVRRAVHTRRNVSQQR